MISFEVNSQSKLSYYLGLAGLDQEQQASNDFSGLDLNGRLASLSKFGTTAFRAMLCRLYSELGLDGASLLEVSLNRRITAVNKQAVTTNTPLLSGLLSLPIPNMTILAAQYPTQPDSVITQLLSAAGYTLTSKAFATGDSLEYLKLLVGLSTISDSLRTTINGLLLVATTSPPLAPSLTDSLFFIRQLRDGLAVRVAVPTTLPNSSYASLSKAGVVQAQVGDTKLAGLYLFDPVAIGDWSVRVVFANYAPLTFTICKKQSGTLFDTALGSNSAGLSLGGFIG
jgi:hypothetical protein